jgi:C-terminal peptidase prc
VTARPRFLPLLLLLIATLACQTLTRAWQPQAGGEQPGTATISVTRNIPASPARTTATQAASATATRSATPAPSATPLPTRTATATQTAAPPPSSLQLRTFEQIWEIVDREYLYPDFNGLDWEEIHAEYRQRIGAGMTDDAFYLAMDEMISRLGDEHSVFLSPAEVIEEEAGFAGENNYVGIGILISPVPERNRATIVVTFPGSPAEEAGLQPHDSILAVDGEPILDELGFLRDVVRGPVGSQIRLTVQSPGEAAREIALTRRQISGAIPVPYQLLANAQGLRVGYLLLVTFNDATIADQVREALEALTETEPLDALILDNRQNTGGANTVLMETLSYFTRGTLGYFVSRSEERPLRIKGMEVGNSMDIPLVVLIGPGTASFGEIFAGILKDQGRAYLIGETTEGNVETLWGYDFEDGSRLWLAHESFRPLNHSDENWEASGIIPHQMVSAGWDEYRLEDDPVVGAALDYLGRRE